MLIDAIDARYVHMKNAQVTLEKYTDGSLALVASDEDEDAYPNHETFSVNLTAYDMHPPEGHVFIKAETEHEGLPQALMDVGLGTIVERIAYGPFGSAGVLFKLSENFLLMERVAGVFEKRADEEAQR